MEPVHTRRVIFLTVLLSYAVRVYAQPQNTDVQVTLQDFTRPGPYPYAICDEQPGEIGTEYEKKNDINALSASCIPIAPGELEFCGSVAYDACVRVAKPFEYDQAVMGAYNMRLLQWQLEFPGLFTMSATSSPPCAEAMKDFLCYMAFPKCIEDEDSDGVFFEQPICWSMCMAAQMACTTDAAVSEAACQTAMISGRVAPDRSDIICHGAAPLQGPSLLLITLVLVFHTTLWSGNVEK